VELEKAFGEAPFNMVDLGSCCGFFSVQAAAAYPQAFVIGVEGSVGVGNGTTGLDGTQDQIIETKAIQTHLRWLHKLQIDNCLLAPDVWDYRRVCSLAACGRPLADATLLLSVVHHIDNVSAEQYEAAGLDRVQGTVSLMAKLLELAPRHFVELPDRPWLDHIYAHFKSARAFLDAAVKATGKQWTFVGPLVVSEWYGRRELWLIEKARLQAGPMPVPKETLKGLFPTLLPSALTPEATNSVSAKALQAAQALQAVQIEHGMNTAPKPVLQASTAPLPKLAPGQLTQAEIGAGILMAPTALIAAHLQLRDAMMSAEALMQAQTPAGSA